MDSITLPDETPYTPSDQHSDPRPVRVPVPRFPRFPEKCPNCGDLVGPAIWLPARSWYCFNPECPHSKGVTP